MQVFISWSGSVSREVAENLASFLRHVVRRIDTFLSTQDIDAGDRWEAKLSDELERTHHAIVCVTRDNQTSPWLNYEAGALSKRLGRAKVIPYTLGFPPSEMQSGPLSRFQGIENNEAGTWSLVRDLNRAVSSPDEESFVREDFDYWWPRLQEKMSEALAGPPEATKKNTPTDRELLLEMRRNVQQLLSHLGNRDGVDIHAAIDVLEEALRDPLTNLANRRAFSERASNLSAEDTPYVIAILDLDHFKQINDKWGHGRGDELLVLVASVINEQLSSADIVARFGGDEFDVIYQSKPPEAVIETLTEFIAALPTFAENAGFPSITASAGVSSDRIEPTELKLRDADRAMYQAKEEGRAMAKLAD